MVHTLLYLTSSCEIEMIEVVMKFQGKLTS